MKKEYLTPDIDVLDLRTLCLDPGQTSDPQTSSGTEVGFMPARRGGIAPAGL